MKKNPDKQPQRLLVFILIALALVAYWQVLDCDFINYDDDEYVTANENVQKGITWESVTWALTKYHSANWHPLTWLSHMLDYQLWELNPKGHHLSNLVFHILNSLLLLLFLIRVTGNFFRSWFVASLFALHPLHVESVAWIAERKDVLSTFFMLLTLLAYSSYAASSSRGKYLLAILLYASGLMSKPMLVTLPLLLILLDYWPLCRFGSKKALSLLQEKIPFVILAAGSCAVTIFVQHNQGATKALDGLSLGVRVANALVSYIAYILKMLWPAKLAVLYPHPENGIPAWQVYGSAALLIILTGLAIWLGRQKRYLAVGWLWYLISLVPVIGLVQVGWQSMADRYTYIPLIGLFIIAAWGLPDLWFALFPREEQPSARRQNVPLKLRKPDIIALCVVFIIIITLTVLTWFQVCFWKNSITLFQHAISVTRDNYIAHENLGIALDKEGKIEEAMAQYRKVISIKPDFAEAYNNLGISLSKIGRVSEAAGCYKKVIQLRPNEPSAWFNLGNARASMGDLKGAEQAFRESVKLKPSFGEAHVMLAMALYMQNKYPEAWRHIHLAQKYGYTPPQEYIDALSMQMPDPGSDD